MIIISTDSTCDLGEEIEKNSIPVMPLNVILDSKVYRDGVDITPEKIFEFVAKTKTLPKTSAATTADYCEFFEELTENGNEVVHFNISSKASVSHSCAVEAAKGFSGKVRVVDSKALSSGQGLLVMKAIDWRNEGKSAEEIESAANALRDKVNTSFVPDTLDYLYKGGRVSGMVKLAAGMFKIHPQILMKDGQLEPGKKYRGKMSVLIKQYVEDLKQMYPKYDKRRCFITHSCADEELVQSAREKVKELFDFEEIVETVAGSVITGHCGRNTLGVLFITE